METKAPIMHTSVDNICNGGLHRYCKLYTLLNIHGGLMFTGKLSDRNQSDIKNIKLIFPCLTSTVFKRKLQILKG